MPGAILTDRQYTFDDLLAIPESGDLYDVLGGQLVVNSAPDKSHAEAVGELWDFLRSAQRAGYGRAYAAPRAVAFDYAARGTQALDVTHPDLFFIRQDRLAINGRRCVEAAPDLIVEVLSPTTRADDEPDGRKYRMYEQYAVPYYWTVDPDGRLIQQYTLGEGRYGPPRTLRPGDTLAAALFPGLTLAVSQVFANIF